MSENERCVMSLTAAPVTGRRGCYAPTGDTNVDSQRGRDRPMADIAQHA